MLNHIVVIFIRLFRTQLIYIIETYFILLTTENEVNMFNMYNYTFTWT